MSDPTEPTVYQAVFDHDECQWLNDAGLRLWQERLGEPGFLSSSGTRV